jgi:hypothetical protein
MIYHYSKFRIPSSNGSSVIAIKPEAKHRFHAVTILFCVLQKNPLTKVAYFSKICYHTSFQDPILNRDSVASTSKVRVRHDGITDCRKLRVRVWSSFQWQKSITNFTKIRPTVLEINYADRRTDAISPMCVHFVHIERRKHKNELFCFLYSAIEILSRSILPS